jgi:4-amino-4-deoxy-L-arabinose transferase-like glycosyltransferase
MFARHWSAFTFTALWMILMAGAIFLRPALPVDETRYLAVAWDMWLHGDYLVPHLNGETYSHKPPLLFWMMTAGWVLFGVNDWWGPLVAPLFGLASLFLTRAIALKLWPERPKIADLAPLVLLGSAFWTFFTTLTMFDMLVTACALAGLLGLLTVWRDGGSKGWWMLAFAIGVGILAKGPVILLQVLPIALLVPFWDREQRIKTRDGGWKSWYVALSVAVLGGALIGLCWAVPAGIYGGDEYRNAIFWGQTAGRMVESFAHALPWWWYLAFIGPLLFPWVVWPTLWRAVRQNGRKVFSESGMRFCLLWFAPIFLAFSLISGKQFHYLLPIFPAFALFLTRLIVSDDIREGRWARILPAGLVALFCSIVGIAPYLGLTKIPDWVVSLPTYWMILPVLIAFIVIVKRLKTEREIILGLVGIMVSLVLSIHFVCAPYLSEELDLRPISQNLKKWQDQGYDIAFVGKYHGTFQFLGRLEHPITEVGSNEAEISLIDWVKQHPHGKVVTIWDEEKPSHPAIDFIQNFRRDNMIVFDIERLKGDLTALNRR